MTYVPSKHYHYHDIAKGLQNHHNDGDLIFDKKTRTSYLVNNKAELGYSRINFNDYNFESKVHDLSLTELRQILTQWDETLTRIKGGDLICGSTMPAGILKKVSGNDIFLAQECVGYVRTEIETLIPFEF